MTSTTPTEQPHRRFDPLADRWVLVSPQRDQRPWQGQKELPAKSQPAYDAACYLCPGNTRAGGAITPQYDSVYAFDNDFPALLPGGQSAETDDPLLRSETVCGRCRVICYSPRHDLRLADLPLERIREVVDLWASETVALSKDHVCVQIFENRGETMGASNPHPHGQIWALDSLPTSLAVEDRKQKDYFLEHGSPLLIDYVQRELAEAERVVLENESWLVVVPWWASWPFETLVMPKAWCPDMPSLPSAARDDLSSALKRLLTAYDRLFDTPFPYSMGWHGAPAGAEQDHWLLHGHFYPPLLRSATVRKHMVGFEMLGEAQRDLTPETAASKLRAVVA